MPLICDLPTVFNVVDSCVFSNVLQTSSGVVIADAIAPAIAPDTICALGL